MHVSNYYIANFLYTNYLKLIILLLLLSIKIMVKVIKIILL